MFLLSRGCLCSVSLLRVGLWYVAVLFPGHTHILSVVVVVVVVVVFCFRRLKNLRIKKLKSSHNLESIPVYAWIMKL